MKPSSVNASTGRKATARGTAPGVPEKKTQALKGRDISTTKLATPVERNGRRMVPLAELCSQDRRMIVPRSIQARALRYLGLENVVAESGEIIQSPAPDEEAGKSTTFAFDERHVLYGKLRPYLNKVALPVWPGRCTTEIIPLLPQSQCDREYLACLLRRPETVEVAMRGVTGSRMPRANLDELFRMEVPLPPLTEQRRLAGLLREQLSAVAEARAALQAQRKAAAALPAALLREVFECAETGEWLTAHIAELAEMLPAASISTAGDVQVRVITSACLSEAGFSSAGIKTATMKKSDAARAMVSAGEILIARSNTAELVGRCAAVPHGLDGVAASDLTIRLLPGPRLDPSFVSRYLAHLQLSGFWKEKAGGASDTMKKITRGQLNALPIPFPPLATQRALAARLDASFAEVAALRAALESCRAAVERLPAALLREVFGA